MAFSPRGCGGGTEGDKNEATTWVHVAVFGELAESMASRLTEGMEVYVEGRLSLSTWTSRDGETKTGLSLVAWEFTPLGQIGRRSPEKKPRPEAWEEALMRSLTSSWTESAHKPIIRSGG